MFGEACNVRVSGIAEVDCGATVSAGDRVMSDAAGKAIPFVVGAGNVVIDVALEDAANGETLAINLNIHGGADA